MRIDLNDLETVISIYQWIKNIPDILQLWKKSNCEKMGKSRGKQWKIFRLIYI